MNFTLKSIVLSARPYRVVDEKSGEVNQGVSIQYYPSDSITPYYDEETKTKGQKVIDDSLPIQMNDKLHSVPGVYEMSCTMSSVKNRNGQSKAQIKVKDIKFVTSFGEIHIPPVEAAKK